MNWRALSLSPELLLALALAVTALAMLWLAGGWLDQARRHNQHQRVLDAAIRQRREGGARAAVVQAGGRAWLALVAGAVELGARWGVGRLGHLLMEEEDRKRVDLAGFKHPVAARSLFLFARVVLSAGLPLLAWWLGHDWRPLGSALLGAVLSLFSGFAVGWMLPKWYVGRRASQRQRSARQELPLLVDLLRLLQGVGLSVDQSLRVVIDEFASALPVLSAELALAVQLHARGRTREQSLQRLASDFGSDDLAAICRLLVQVEQHGGAVQEPLLRFAERMRERRKLELKEETGKLTVKMTGVMVVTLMPALLIVTGGMGFLAVLRGMAQMGGGG